MIAWILGLLKRDRRGTLAVEMAMATPVVVGLLLSGIEITRYVLLNQKIERASATMADLVPQAQTLSEGGLANLYTATTYVLEPFDLAADGQVVVSSISASNGNPARINWQRSFGAGSGGSAFGVEGGTASLPTGFVVRDNETVVVTEVFYGFQPMFFDTELVHTQLVAGDLYSFAVFRPRFSSLTTINP